MILPVRFNKIYRRYGQIVDGKFHNGIDLGCEFSGEYVYSVAKGKVIFSGLAVGYGGLKPRKQGGVIFVLHEVNGKQFIVQYGHVTNKTVSQNRIVDKGDLLGFVTDFEYNGSKIPHLHLAFYDDKILPGYPWGYVDQLGKWVNPNLYFKEF